MDKVLRGAIQRHPIRLDYRPSSMIIRSMAF